MYKWIKKSVLNWIAKREAAAKANTVGYLGRDLSKHRVHSHKYEDLCK